MTRQYLLLFCLISLWSTMFLVAAEEEDDYTGPSDLQKKQADNVKEQLQNEIKQPSASDVASVLMKQMMHSKSGGAPIISWPQSFEMQLSSQTDGINFKERILIDQPNRRIRIQIKYSIMDLADSTIFDMTIIDRNQIVAFRSKQDCKVFPAVSSTDAISLFFMLFNQFTEYKGWKDDLHVFRLKKMQEEKSQGFFSEGPQMFMMFDGDDFGLRKIRYQDSKGEITELFAEIPPIARKFGDADFNVDTCSDSNKEQVKLDTIKNIGFMKQIYTEFAGKENDMILKITDQVIDAALLGDFDMQASQNKLQKYVQKQIAKQQEQKQKEAAEKRRRNQQKMASRQANKKSPMPPGWPQPGTGSF